jgi:hypothetical protein
MSSAGGSEETSALITRIAAGDRDAFSRFYDLLAPTAFGLIRRVLRDPEAAAEVLQEVFWQVWREAPRDRTFVAPVDESVAQSHDGPAENPAVVAEDRGLGRVIELAFSAR